MSRSPEKAKSRHPRWWRREGAEQRSERSSEAREIREGKRREREESRVSGFGRKMERRLSFSKINGGMYRSGFGELIHGGCARFEGRRKVAGRWLPAAAMDGGLVKKMELGEEMRAIQ